MSMKNHAASQFRRKRMSSPSLPALIGSGSDPQAAGRDSTPPRAREVDCADRAAAPVTPEQQQQHAGIGSRSNSLRDALEMAARPSPGRGRHDTGDEEGVGSVKSFKSVKSAPSRVGGKKPSSRSKKLLLVPSPEKRGGRASGSDSGKNSGKSSRGRKSSVSRASQAGSATAPQKKVWLVAVPILLAFLACEFFLWLLVFRSNDGSAAGELAKDVIDGDVVGDLDPFSRKREGEEGGKESIPEQRNESDLDEPSEEDSGIGEGGQIEKPEMDAKEPLKEPDVDDEEPLGESDVARNEPSLDVKELAEDPNTDVKEPIEEAISMKAPSEESGMSVKEQLEDPVKDGKESTEEPKMDAKEPTEEPKMNAQKPMEDSSTDVTELPLQLEEPVIDGKSTEEPKMDAKEPTEEPKMNAKKPMEDSSTDVTEFPPEFALDAEELPEETALELNDEEIVSLKSMLEEGFARSRGTVEGSDEESSRKLAESLCGSVWATASKRLSEQDIELSKSTLPDMTLEKLSQISAWNPWKSLALDAQRCLGGAGLAFLTEDADMARLAVTTKIFDRLSYLEPYDLNIRAGLGTSLLFESIFGHESVPSDADESNDVERSLLMAKHHLTVASFLCSPTPQANIGDGSNEANVSKKKTAATSKKSLRVDDEMAVAHAAILHNLALVHVALGDSESSVPILLQAAALRRDRSIDSIASKPYWNAPHDLLRAMEDEVLSIAASMKKTEKGRGRRVPFLGTELDAEKMAGMKVEKTTNGSGNL